LSFSATRWPTPEGERERDESSNDGSASPRDFWVFPCKNKRGRGRGEHALSEVLCFSTVERESKKRERR
jgi:hypothetical protein